ncbi:MAG TPA: hypothetical protein VF680_17465 [Allosphingosinicella sp.]|jgi:hypothetical protein
MNRITEKQLQAVVDRINRTLNKPMAPYIKGDDGFHVAQIGNYCLSHAYGGVALHQICNLGGGVHAVLGFGHVPKRELYDQMHAFLKGIEAAREGVTA